MDLPEFNVFLLIVLYCIQSNHRMTTTMQRRIYGHATDVEIRPLNEEKAVQAAVDLIGELFVFTVIFISFHSILTCFLYRTDLVIWTRCLKVIILIAIL